MPFENFEEFLQFRDKMRKEMNEEKKDMRDEDIWYLFMPGRRYNSSPC